METIRDRHAKLPILTVPGALGEPQRVIDVAASLEFAEREVFANLLNVRAGRPVAAKFPDSPDEVGDFEVGLEMYRSFQTVPSNVNPVIGMGKITRREGLRLFREEPTKFALQKREWAKVLQEILGPLEDMWRAMAPATTTPEAPAAEPPACIRRARELLDLLQKDPNV